MARPGRRGRSRATWRAGSRHTASSFPATAVAACSRQRRRRPPAALDDNRRAIDEARTLDAPCLVLVVGGLPGALQGRPESKTSPLPAATSATASPASSNTPATSACRWRSSRCTRCTPPTAPASTRWNTHSTSATSSTPSHDRRPRRRRRRLPRLVGPQACRRRSLAPAAHRLLAFHVCDWLVPTRDLLNDRGMMGDGVIDLPQMRRWVEACRIPRLQRGRDLLDRELVEARRRRGARHLHRTPPQRGLTASGPTATQRAQPSRQRAQAGASDRAPHPAHVERARRSAPSGPRRCRARPATVPQVHQRAEEQRRDRPGRCPAPNRRRRRRGRWRSRASIA